MLASCCIGVGAVGRISVGHPVQLLLKVYVCVAFAVSFAHISFKLITIDINRAEYNEVSLCMNLPFAF